VGLLWIWERGKKRRGISFLTQNKEKAGERRFFFVRRKKRERSACHPAMTRKGKKGEGEKKKRDYHFEIANQLLRSKKRKGETSLQGRRKGNGFASHHRSKDKSRKKMTRRTPNSFSEKGKRDGRC